MVLSMQLLIDALFLENPAQVKLYALPVIPHMVQCHPSVKIKFNGVRAKQQVTLCLAEYVPTSQVYLVRYKSCESNMLCLFES
jgi:hypothetical protein